MGKISNMSLQAILNQIDIGFKREDIEVFCSDQNVRNEIIFMTNEGRDFKDVLLRNEDKIDKEKLVLISYQTFKEKLEDKREARDKEKLEKYINNRLEYTSDCISLALTLASEAKLSFLEALEAQAELDEK